MFQRCLLATAAVCLLSLPVAAQTAERPTPAAAQTAAPLTKDKDRISYAVGIAFGRSLLQQGPHEFNYDIVVKGMTDAFNKSQMQLSESEFRAIYANFQKAIVGKMGHAKQVAAMENDQAGQKFLEENKTKPGVVVLPSGLQYKVLKGGTGPKPLKTDTVIAHYRGTLIDGTEIDNTFSRGQPAKFGLGRSIAGWREALQLMSTGSKWEIYVPGDLAYGKNGVGATVGPNATLIFDIELISIEKATDKK